MADLFECLRVAVRELEHLMRDAASLALVCVREGVIRRQAVARARADSL